MNTCPRCRRTYADGVRFCPIDGALIAAVVDPYLGKSLMGQFHLVAVAGRGSMGTVYRAEQSRMNRPVAVKVLRTDLLRDETAVQRFLREAQAAARLSHPNIVTVHLVSETEDGAPFMVMEYVEGTTLGTLLEQEKVLPPERALHIARHIASALAEAHSHGIVHRDLKADNILLAARRTERDFVKVLDFGIAKLLSAEGGEIAQLTRDGTIFGTPHYIAPEQAAGQDVDGRADLYSLGVILFRAVTGRLPFDGNSGMQVLSRHLKEQPPRPRALRPELPESVQALILTALEKDRERRFHSAEAFVAALDSVQAGLEEPADPSRTLMGVPLPPRPGQDSRQTAPTAMAPRDGAPVPAPTEELAHSGPTASPVPAGVASVGSGRTSAAATTVWTRPVSDLARRAGEPGPPGAAEGAAGALPRDAADHPAWSGERSSEEIFGIRARRRRLAAMVAGAGAVLVVVIGWAALRRSGAPAPAKVAGARSAVEERAAPVGASAAPANAPAPSLEAEQVATAGGYTLRMGFEFPPAAEEPNVLYVFLDDHRGGRGRGARVEASVRRGGEPDSRVPLRADGDEFAAGILFRAAGRHQVQVTVELPGGERNTATFDVNVAAGQVRVSAAPGREPASGRATRPRRHGNASPADEAAQVPVTVIPATPSAPTDLKPRALGPTPSSAPAPAAPRPRSTATPEGPSGTALGSAPAPAAPRPRNALAPEVPSGTIVPVPPRSEPTSQEGDDPYQLLDHKK